MPTFLQIPRELRDLIYEYYFYSDGGYTHDFESNKLRQANGDRIELALTYVCRQFSIESRGVALHVNKIHFTALHSDTIQKPAALIHANYKLIHRRKASLVNESAPTLLGLRDAQILKKAYPQFTPIIDGWRSHGQFNIFGRRYVTCGEAPSSWHDFVDFTLNLLSQHPDFAEKAKAESRFWPAYEGNQAFGLNNACPEPWSILSTADIERLRETVTGVCYDFPYIAESTEYAYSAAQIAIRFLRSIPATTCNMIRNIDLLEDRESVAGPACHGRGFITFCQAHPRLRIERSISVWKALIPVALNYILMYQNGLQHYIEDGLMDDDRCPAERITKAVGMWVAEALLLLSLGMPRDSFTLIIDGSPTPDHTSRVLCGVIQRDLAWQTALDISYTRGLLPMPSWLDRRLCTGFIYEGLPDVMHKLSRKSSLIRTNFDFEIPHFDLDSPSHDVEELLEEHRGWTMQDWEKGWATHEPAGFQTEAPLPPWHILRWQKVTM